MDEDTAIINENTRKEKIKVFFVKNTKKIIIVISTLVLILFGEMRVPTYIELIKIDNL